MAWDILFHGQFEPEFDRLDQAVQDELLAKAGVLEQFGPRLGRPTVDTVKGSRYPNMKELRFDCAGGVWRVAFAFDPRRKAILLACGNKAGIGEQRFYTQLIQIADARFGIHLMSLKHPRGKRK